MTDPISISASIAGLVTLADIVARKTCKYAIAAKESQKEISTLLAELSTLSGVLRGVENVASELELEDFETNTRVHHVRLCEQSLNKLDTVLSKYDCEPLRGKKMEVLHKLKWPFAKPKTVELIDEFKRHQETLKLALASDSASMLLKLLSRQDETGGELRDLKSQVKEFLDVQLRIRLDKRHEKVLKSFAKTDPRLSYHANIRLRKANTGIWFLESTEFQTWLETKNSRLWIYGIPGAGKTILASITIEETIRRSNPENGVAYFFCDYKNSETSIPINILGSIVHQLGRQSEGAFQKIEEFYTRYGSSDISSTSYNPEDICNLIIDVTRFFDNVMLVVDGLDECDNYTGDVVELLVKLSASKSIKCLFLSREFENIKTLLGGWPSVSIAARNQDLRLYVLSEIELRTKRGQLEIYDQTLKDQIVRRLTEEADGM